MPEEGALGPVGGRFFKDVGEAPAVAFFGDFDSGEFEKSGVDVFDDDGGVSALIFRGDVGPMDD